MKRFLVGFAVILGALPLASQTRYVVTDLASLGGVSPYGGAPASAQAINNAGQVVGSSYLPTGETRGFRTAPNKAIHPAADAIGTLGGASSFASAINSFGQVAGAAQLADTHTHAIRVDADGSIHDLGFLGGTINFSLANGINDSGQVTGASWRATPAFGPPCFGIGGSDAFLTSANSAMVPGNDLGTLLSNCRGSDGYGVDSSGRVVGYSAFGNVSNPVQHAMLATPGSGLTDLGVLGGVVRFPAISGIQAVAYRINTAGQIVGASTYNGAPFYYAQHAFLTTKTGPMMDLGTLGGNFSSAFGINTAGQIVGNATTSLDAANHGFLYTGGVMNDLNGMLGPGSGWEIENASAINDNGQIVGQGKLSDGTRHAVRMDPADAAVTILTNLLSDPSLGLTGGQMSSLTDKLNNALASIQGGLYAQAIHQLDALIHAVQAQVKVGKMSAATGDTLISTANAIIAALS